MRIFLTIFLVISVLENSLLNLKHLVELKILKIRMSRGKNEKIY